MARLKLDLEPSTDFTVIGISSHVNDYRLCWSLNRSLGLALARRQQDVKDTAANGSASFAAFEHEDPETQVRYTLVSNRSEHGVLLREQRQADYFLVVDAEDLPPAADLLERVRGAEFVLTAFPLDLKSLRSGHKLLG